MDNVIVMSVGAFISIALAANAFLFKQMVTGLAKVELGLAVLMTENKEAKKDILRLEVHIEEHQKTVNKLSHRLVKVESTYVLNNEGKLCSI